MTDNFLAKIKNFNETRYKICELLAQIPNGSDTASARYDLGWKLKEINLQIKIILNQNNEHKNNTK